MMDLLKHLKVREKRKKEKERKGKDNEKEKEKELTPIITKIIYSKKLRI